MGGGVPLAVPVFPAFPRHRSLQGRRQVPPHVRIGPLLDGYRRGRVRHKDVQQPVPPSPPGGCLLQ